MPHDVTTSTFLGCLRPRSGTLASAGRICQGSCSKPKSGAADTRLDPRSALAELLDYIHDGGTLIITRLDRNSLDLHAIIGELKKKG